MRITTSLFLILAFVLAGCFQQAGEPLDQPGSGQSVPGVLPSATPLLPNSDGVTPSFPATATLPVLTIISPTQKPIVLPTATDETLPTPLAPSGEDATADTGGSTFITPSSPLGPVTAEPVTPIPFTTPTATPSGLITPTALPIVSDSADGCVYVIQPGDNLFRIAVNHDITLDELREANPQIVGDLIQPGDEINIPGCGAGTDTGETTTTDTGESTDTGVVVPTGGTTHTVQRGETLYSIARQYGVTVQGIINANTLANPNNLTPGQELIIPPVGP
ncbi:MAG: LysM peptidoglycan-binding domain-containing protein [Anaerolineaceae bacterium]|nr:LysM peptidoglycan-binding domain-containing protein [Anaerolineaceae bacterium]